MGIVNAIRRRRTKRRMRRGIEVVEHALARARARSEAMSMARVAGFAGAAVAGLAGAAAIYLVRNGNTVHVLHVRHDDQGWSLARDGAEENPERFSTKREAIAAGRAQASASAPSELQIHRRNGSVARSHRYGAGGRWARLARRRPEWLSLRLRASSAHL